MLKDGSQLLLAAVLNLFNDVISSKVAPPTAWKKTKLTLIFKKGDPTLAGNYRPIAVISFLYKLFSRIQCDRLIPFIIAAQTVEQAAYRKGFNTVDHLLAVTLVMEKSREFNLPLWVAMVDFEKAFDSVEHEPLWEVLRKQGVPSVYIALLRRLYVNQEACVQAGTRSRGFPVTRGVKQGDPISGLLFIAVMQACFGDLNKKWAMLNHRRQGMKFGIDVDGRVLTELRFADDVLLFSQQRSDVTKMLSHLSGTACKFGLKINFSKTKVLTWNSLAEGLTSLKVGEDYVKILDETEAERYLGWKLSFQEWHETELSNRIAAGWAAFHKHKGELCSARYNLRDRVRLFNSVVSPAVLYGSAVWTLKCQMEKRLRTAWRRMLRFVFRIHRRRCESTGDAEGWVDFMIRSAHQVDALAAKHGLESWLRAHRRQKWRLAGRLVQQTDGRWSKAVLEWTPMFGRNRGRPHSRWEDQLVQYAGGGWADLAADEAHWAILEEGFIKSDELKT